MYYAIRNKKTKRFVTGTDYRYPYAHQRTCDNVYPPLLFTGHQLDLGIDHREISPRYYEIVEVDVKVKAVYSITDDNIETIRELSRKALLQG